MSQDSHQELLAPRIVGPGPQSRSQLSLVLGERTFDVDPLGVHMARKAALEGPAVPTPRPLARASHVDRCHQRADPQKLPAELVMALAVVGRIRQDLVESDSRGAFHHRGCKVGRVIAGAPAYLSGQPQITSRVTQHRQLGKGARPEVPGVGTLAAEVEAYMAGFVAGRVDRPFGILLDQAAAVGAPGNRVEQSIETPFFKRRW